MNDIIFSNNLCVIITQPLFNFNVKVIVWWQRHNKTIKLKDYRRPFPLLPPSPSKLFDTFIAEVFADLPLFFCNEKKVISNTYRKFVNTDLK